MAKFEKFKHLKHLAKAKASGLVRHEKVGGFAKHGLRYGLHAVLGLGTKAMPGGMFNQAWLKPDIIGTAAMGLASFFTKGNIKKGLHSGIQGGLHAILGRWIASGSISVVSGPDGKLHFG